MSGKSKNLDVYLAEIFKQFVALKDNDFKKSQEVFKSVFEQMMQKMREQCNYFNRYASQVMYAGSVYDGIKVSRLDEFDMDIVIRLPINYDSGENGIILENDQPGFIKMKITRPFDNLDKQPDWETHHKVTRDWRDSNKYLLQNKFRQWMHGVVQRALNELGGRVHVNGDEYSLSYKASGPAYTLNITGADGFTLDVDLVPVVRFQTPRWPDGYRCIAGSQVKEWLVVPKPNKCIEDAKLQNRCWRLSFQDFEREMMKGCNQLKSTIRLVKKLRDALGMKAIASYYIKTLFLWKVDETDKKFWETKISFTFRSMVQALHDAIVVKNIKYFWHEENNLIETLKPSLQKLYAEKLKAVLNSIDSNDVDKVVASLLTHDELTEFKKSKFYTSQVSQSNSGTSISSLNSGKVSRQESVSNDTLDSKDNQTVANLVQLVKSLTDKVNSLTENVSSLTDKVDSLTNLTAILEDKVKRLELEKKHSKTTDDLKDLSFCVNSISVTSCAENSVAAPVLGSMCKSETVDLLTF